MILGQKYELLFTNQYMHISYVLLIFSCLFFRNDCRIKKKCILGPQSVGLFVTSKGIVKL